MDDDTDNLMMSLFLDTLMTEAMKDPSSLVPYTEEMNQEIDELLADVKLEVKQWIPPRTTGK